MGGERYNRFSRSRQVMWPFRLSVAESGIAPKLTAEVTRRERAKDSYRDRKAEHAGTDTSFVWTGVFLLRFLATGVANSVLSFTVPGSRVLQLQHVDFFFTEPYLYGSQQFGWRIAVDGQQVPWFGNEGFARNDYRHGPLIPAGTGGEARIEPLYIQGGSTVSVDVVELTWSAPPTDFNANTWAGATMFGILHKPVRGGE
jgi:hypothetical protein